MSPNPRPYEEIIFLEDVAEIRQLDCARYNDCLSVAVERGWPGFTCGEGRCRMARSPEERRRDDEAALEMLGASARAASPAGPRGARRLAVQCADLCAAAHQTARQQ